MFFNLIVRNSKRSRKENGLFFSSLVISIVAFYIILSITDNGSGVKSYDLPYIFQKGFTGDSANNRNKATGMGLYLTKKMADDLNLKLDVQSEYNSFFKISIQFPI